MDVKRVIFISATFLIVALLVVLYGKVEDTTAPASATNLEEIVIRDLPKGWELMQTSKESPDSISFYILTDQDTLLVLERNSCKGLDATASTTQCLEKNIQQYLPTREFRDAARVSSRPSSSTHLNGKSAFVTILDNRRSNFLIEVYKIESANGPIFATITIPDNVDSNYINKITSFLNQVRSKES